MRRRYSVSVRPRHPSLPRIWLLSDARNDAALEQLLARLPRGSGFIFRHYHLDPTARRARWQTLRRAASARGHIVVLAASGAQARAWGADGVYASASRVGHRHPRMLWLAPAHDLRELAGAVRGRARAVLLSPVYPTRSHPGAATLGPVRFRRMAALAPVPVIALGGMTPKRARALRWHGWAAIDGLGG